MVDRLTYEEAHRVFRYCPESGSLFWKVASRGHRAGGEAGSVLANGYRYVRVKGRAYLAHRVIWLMNFGEWPSALIDHIDRDVLNNRLQNLREATKSQNNQNSVGRRHGGKKGASLDPRDGRWKSQIMINRKCIFLGRFKTECEAHEAYKRAAVKYFGEFARFA